MPFALSSLLSSHFAQAEVGVVLTYFALCREDHHWWWRAFGCTASAGAYLLAYALLYARHGLHLSGTAAHVIYFGYSLLGAACLSLVTSAVAFLAALQFVYHLYASLKFD